MQHQEDYSPFECKINRGVLKGVVRSIFIFDILKVLIPGSTLLFTRTKTEQICLRYPQPQVTSPKNGFGRIRR